MNRKYVLILGILFLTFTAFVGKAFAMPTRETNFEQYKIVGSFGSFIEKTVFDLEDPSPFLYMRLPRNGQATSESTWTNPDSVSFAPETTDATSPDRWVSLSDWLTVKKEGFWEVESSYLYPNSEHGFATASFTVTPEPISTALFLIGGAPMVANLYRKKKKNVVVA